MVLFIEFQENAGDGRKGGGGGGGRGNSAKRSSHPEVANLEVKVQVRDLVRVVGIVTPFATRGRGGGVNIPGKFVLLSPRGSMDTGYLCRVPPAAVRHGRTRKSSGTGPCGNCRGVVGIVVPFAPRGLFGESLFCRAPEGKWTQEICVGCPKQRHATEEAGKV